ncbi:hypothetical protein COCSUDRAFT_55516 [Coccomyxa subellipsoidea C-169]|uniref:Uncharacterized protein n=1 Tax=Coccomyxa subellipsoidea (strain C-169) TaxID=574566 RepID=I0ZA44_COCSC|nr:hypothetical protein COCSUDRAFT_55516 [Coccomyxa subellipsoidea C-169]EIE27513.1 hypothetical protein COCSUDRAFT_55516 [Coccomyxa subellipsoidea C-169]|eukprot:XP_005652057.1 hypothetical protein COCSUDRAFT_55516 [Coccomyxa subellipsoidea C-169]
MQPPTVAHFEFPAEYSRYNGGGYNGNSSSTTKTQPRRAEAAYPQQRSPGHQQANGRVPHAQTNGRAAQPHHSSQRSNGGGAAQQRTTSSNPQPRAAAPRAVAQPRQPLPQQAAAAGVNGAAHAPPVASTLPASPRQAAAVPVQAQLTLESSARPAAAKAEPEQEGLKLSKSQLMRLRKKKREGKV